MRSPKFPDCARCTRGRGLGVWMGGASGAGAGRNGEGVLEMWHGMAWHGTGGERRDGKARFGWELRILLLFSRS